MQGPLLFSKLGEIATMQPQTVTAAQTEAIQLPNVQLSVEYSITAGDLLVSVLLTALIAVVVASWIYQVIFKRGG